MWDGKSLKKPCFKKLKSFYQNVNKILCVEKALSKMFVLLIKMCVVREICFFERRN